MTEPVATDAERLAVLRRYGILDTPAEAEFDDAAKLAAAICATPVALVSLVDVDRQWFKAKVGTDMAQTGLDTSVCALAIRQDDVFVIENLATDPRTAGMSLVANDPSIRFYAGAPMITSGGHALGSLCAIDVLPRPGGLTPEQTLALRVLARHVTAQIELRAAMEERDVETARAQEAERKASDLNATLQERVETALHEQAIIEEALRQSQKMEAVGQLTGGLAHDFNNLLAGISGSLELMQARMQQGRMSDVERYMTAAQGAVRRAAALTHRLLAFSRRQTLDPVPTDVNQLIGGMHDMIQRTVGPSIAIEVVSILDLWPALVDQSQLENALLNLCINARDAMPNGGRVTVETANISLGEQAARRYDLPEGEYLSLCVTDTGAGMAPEVIARAFEPFFTTKPMGEGTGLGLSMIYGFAQQSGGQVRIDSEVGQGATVCIYLPRHHGEVVHQEVRPREGKPPRSDQGETVLVVDDEPIVRMLVTEILEELGYTAIEAGDSIAGLKVLQSDVRIDLLVTDVGLPGGMNGRQLADAGRVKRPDLQVLFITGYAENAIIGGGQVAPGMAVLTKPFAMEAMADRIRSMTQASRPV